MSATLIEIFGNVQGVGFRAFVTRAARAQGLRGWVRNRRDGSVEAMLIGDPAAVAAVIERCRQGPSLARVNRVDTFPAQDDGALDFAERATV
jgi:acylphosphatase